ncbi:hypothetical protein RC98_07940 [Pectobacterium carotovorum subsp. carotovorum]|nr:hypothetical protein RC98_07940 [Pectobacterium carotovorum subsp. carotovorum]KML70962.1 hypothetical protein G032_07000 [Pectobacterium carotovorum subsp. carotovorum ICMP 5702]
MDLRLLRRNQKGLRYGLLCRERPMVVTLLSNQLDPQSDHHLLPMLKENEMCIWDTFHVKILNKWIKTKIPLKFP